MDLLDLLKKTNDHKASDLHITVGIPPVLRVNGELQHLGEQAVSPEDNINMVKALIDDKKCKYLDEYGEIDTSYSYPGVGRFRVNIYKQRGTYGIAIRSVALSIPTFEQLGLPPVIETLATKKRGLVLVTGPTGSGKSTTLAAMVDKINRERNSHILTLEDPIEYLHKHNKSMVNQREIGSDSRTFANALRASLRQDPDVILVGEMRDLETIETALTAAETGHLVFSTVHTIGAAKTVDRIIDVFPPTQKQQITMQLSTVLQGVVSQQLIPKADGTGRVAALEIMTMTPAISNLIREGKTHQIPTAIQTGVKFGMQTMDNALLALYNRGVITKDVLLNSAMDRNMMQRYLGV